MTISDLVKIKKPEVRALHLTWFAFFICFYVWFNMAPLATTMARQLGWLTLEDLSLLALCNVALTVPVRIFIGMALDRWGPRRVFSVLMITMTIPVFLFAFGNSLTQFLISRLLLGCVGAGFVVGTHMTALWFKPQDIGFASGIYAGWGNFGSAAVAITLPSIALYFFDEKTGWRYAIALSGIIMLCYGVYYRFAITDGPPWAILRKPRKVAALEVSSRADMIQLLLWTIPVMGILAIPVWKINRMGYLGPVSAAMTYGIVILAVVYQVIQVLKVNIPILRKGVPTDDRYAFTNVWVLNLTYMTTFGAGLAVVSILPAFFEMTFKLTPTWAGLIASSYAFFNLFARPLGGVLSDRMKSRRKIMQVYMLGTAIGFFIMGTMNNRWPLGAVVMVTVLCAFFEQGGSGATFAMLPMVKRRLTGQISGMVGAYGNIGAMIYLMIYSFVDSRTFFFALGGGAFVSFLACLFFLQEPKAAFSNEYQLSSVDRDIEGEVLLKNLKLDEGVGSYGSSVEEEQIQMSVAHDDSPK